MSDKAPKYKEELTTKMHGEFSVAPKTDRKHIVFSALSAIRELNFTIDEAIEMYNVTEKELQDHSDEYQELLSV